MKNLALLIAITVAIGCGKPEATAASGPGSGSKALAQTLDSMPASQRADYIKAHLDEVRSSAGIKSLPQK